MISWIHFLLIVIRLLLLFIFDAVVDLADDKGDKDR
jgi:hypothetical protein